jgi:hypothetical protein
MTLTSKEISRKRRIDRKLVLQKLPNICLVCGTDQELHVHHKDLKKPDGDLSNLMILCQNCHYRYHELSQLRKIAKSRLELRYGREIRTLDRIYFYKRDIPKSEKLAIDMQSVIEPHIQSYILLKTLLNNWRLITPISLEAIHECFTIADNFKKVLLTQKDWKRQVKALTEVRSRIESITHSKFSKQST